MKEESDIPYGHVRVFCKDCKATYDVKMKSLKRKAEENRGCFPCEKCGSHNTTWEFRH